MSDNKRREFWIDIRDNFDAEVVHYEKPNHVQGELIHVIEYDASREKAIDGMYLDLKMLLSYDPMVDKYKLKQFFQDHVKPTLAAFEKVNK